MHVCMDVCIQLYSCIHVCMYSRMYGCIIYGCMMMYVFYFIEVGMQLHKKLELQEAHHTASPSLSLGNHPNRSCFGLVNLHDSAN